MPSSNEIDPKAHQCYVHLMRLHERLISKLDGIAKELKAPGTEELVREARRRTGDPERTIADATSAVEEALRVLKVSDSKIRLALTSESDTLALEGVSNLPPSLARFLAERQRLPGFTFQVSQDEVRGWVILWKEMTGAGTVRGSGQFYERPYAWLDD